MKLHEVPELHRVFVYGSLKRGFGNHEMFLGGSLFVSEAETDEQRFDMLSLNFFPGVVDDGEIDISGELYLVDDEQLISLDALEGNGTMYARELVWLKGEELPAWMYVYLHRSPSWMDVTADEMEYRHNHRIDRTNGVAKWLPDPNPPTYNFSGFDKLWAKWGKKNPLDSKEESATMDASSDGDDGDDSFEFDADSVEWMPDPNGGEKLVLAASEDALDQPGLLSEEAYTMDAEFKAMQEWLAKA